jgi:hypothetical protein
MQLGDSGYGYKQRVDSENDGPESFVAAAAAAAAVVGLGGTATGADTEIEAGTGIEVGIAAVAVVAGWDKSRWATRVVLARGVALVTMVVVVALRMGLWCEVVGVGKKRSERECWEEEKKGKKSCCCCC